MQIAASRRPPDRRLPQGETRVTAPPRGQLHGKAHLAGTAESRQQQMKRRRCLHLAGFWVYNPLSKKFQMLANAHFLGTGTLRLQSIWQHTAHFLFRCGFASTFRDILPGCGCMGWQCLNNSITEVEKYSIQFYMFCTGGICNEFTKYMDTEK